MSHDLGLKLLLFLNVLDIIIGIPPLLGSYHLKFLHSILVVYGHEKSNFTNFIEGDQLGTGRLYCWTELVNSINEAEYIAKNELCRNEDEEPFILNKSTDLSLTAFSTNLHNTWNVYVNEVQEGQTFAKVTLWTELPAGILNLVLTTCCHQVYLNSSNDDYFKASFLLVAYVTPLRPINNSRDFINRERNYEFVAVEVSPCPCDMTEGHCDTYCCCDKDCKNILPQLFDCLPGLEGGFVTEDLLDWRCDLGVHSPASDLHSLICIEWDNSPFLGYHFHDYAKITDIASLNSVLQTPKVLSSQLDLHIFPEISDTLLKGISYGSFYYYGKELKVSVNNRGKTSVESLHLPFSIYNGKCLGIYPISYLQSFKTECNVHVKELCTSPYATVSLLSAENFALGTINGVAIGILKRPQSKESADINVNYLCAKTVSTFLMGYSTDTAQTISSSNSNCAFERFGNNSELLPYFNEGICYNAVIKVTYDLFWKGGEISLVNITVTLADIPVETNDDDDALVTLTQKFSASFHYISILDTILGNETVYSRSGNPGYEFGHSVLVALESFNIDYFNVTENFTVQLGPYLNIWKPELNGFCDSATTQPVLFGVNALSGCLLQTTLRDFSNCTALRSRIETLQRSLVIAEYVSRGGDYDVTKAEDFIPLLREGENIAEDVAYLRSSNGRKDALPWQQWIEDHTISCADIPSHVEIDIIYVENGLVENHPIYTIVGSKVRFHGSTWIPHCWPGCHDDILQTGLVFSLTSAVHFIEKSSESGLQVSRYWRQNHPHSCIGETCWEELLYPLLAQFRIDPLPQALACLLLLMGFIGPWLYLAR